MQEEWRIVPEFPNYEVSNLGGVKSRRSLYYLKPFGSGPSGPWIKLRKNGKSYQVRVDRLVASAFGERTSSWRTPQKAVRIVETNEIFPTTKACAAWLGVPPSRVTSVLRGRLKSVRGFHIKYVV